MPPHDRGCYFKKAIGSATRNSRAAR
jgi:hypothetical protein